MKFLPVILIVGIVLNFICVLVFRLKLDRHYNTQFHELSVALKSDISKFALDSLRSIDNYFVSNSLSISSSVSTNNIVSVNDEVFYKDGGEWFYTFYRNNDLDYARVGIVDFFVGSNFPRGGVITAIYPDFVVVDNKICIRNRNTLEVASASSSIVSDKNIPDVQSVKTEYKPNLELNHYVKSTHTMRK